MELWSEWIDYHSPAGAVAGYLARPRAVSGPAPGVVARTLAFFAEALGPVPTVPVHEAAPAALRAPTRSVLRSAAPAALRSCRARRTTPTARFGQQVGHPGRHPCMAFGGFLVRSSNTPANRR
jgi:hypothetical protein